MVLLPDGCGLYEAVKGYVVKRSLLFGRQCSVGYFTVCPYGYDILYTNGALEDK